MFTVTIDVDKCEGCGECTEGCPADILEMDGDKAAVSGDPSDCLGCETCVTVCPNGAISIEES
ncbi:indolepyruvate ferredoxin oxidoreductase subunit alpha [Desulfoscipio geothermicus]|uniref:4Fe-4S dicluster domain-containing protein n=1 Tax=Desulfoscipio geothermicus DSM 3669 TaxID=1121426 RepID=A0A1I6DR79_9FIRM|nr:4Fe-4S dicluster domain-containing protein [Desulfoscipio geothermicus]SFR07872.1 4Fe-4S dicluster domain-containing protein [Desulfoscipio geothermicus DSM 3669]